jgi:hypothetical protein
MHNTDHPSSFYPFPNQWTTAAGYGTEQCNDLEDQEDVMMALFDDAYSTCNTPHWRITVSPGPPDTCPFPQQL